MQKLDVAIAGAGAVVLLVAIVGAAVNDAPAGAEYGVSFSESVVAGAPIALGLEGAARASATFEVPDLNVTQVTVKVYVNTTAAPGGYSARVALTSPGGATAEKEGATGPAAGVQAFLGIEVSIDLPASAQGGRVRATGADDALRQAAVANATAGRGNWTIDVSFAPEGPLPPQGVAGVGLPSWSVLRGAAQLVPPESR